MSSVFEKKYHRALCVSNVTIFLPMLSKSVAGSNIRIEVNDFLTHFGSCFETIPGVSAYQLDVLGHVMFSFVTKEN